MPRWVLVFVLAVVINRTAFSTTELESSGDSPGAVSIQVSEVTKILVERSKLRLSRICRTRRTIFGCTFFANERLSCSCHRAGDAWQMRTMATFRPVMFLSSLSFEEHEQKHVEHVRAMLEGHLRHLTQNRYPSQRACQQAAAAAEADFVVRMNNLRARSNSELD